MLLDEYYFFLSVLFYNSDTTLWETGDKVLNRARIVTECIFLGFLNLRYVLLLLFQHYQSYWAIHDGFD